MRSARRALSTICTARGAPPTRAPRGPQRRSASTASTKTATQTRLAAVKFDPPTSDAAAGLNGIAMEAERAGAAASPPAVAADAATTPAASTAFALAPDAGIATFIPGTARRLR